MWLQRLPAVLELGKICCVRISAFIFKNCTTNDVSRDPKNSPLFDGSATSMSGNGLFVDYPGIPIPLAPPGLNDLIPPAGGGGCVTTGPFKKYIFQSSRLLSSTNTYL